VITPELSRVANNTDSNANNRFQTAPSIPYGSNFRGAEFIKA